MSQTKKVLKQIASSEEYQTLVTAIEKADYESIFNSYIQIAKQLEDAGKEINEKIQGLTRRNKEEDSQKFQSAFALRAESMIPRWYWLNTELKKQGITEGEVIGLGSKGDPLARTPEGRIVVIRGTALKEGDKVKFRVVATGEKIDFGRVFELTPQFLYFIFNQETHTKINDLLATIREQLNKYQGNTDQITPEELAQLLKQLAEIRELTDQLQSEEKERLSAILVAYRKRLFRDFIPRLAFELLSRTEENEIKESCLTDEERSAALSAHGLFRRDVFEAAKTGLFSGDKIKGYDEMLTKLESNLDSMNSALQFMEFKAAMEEMALPAKRYVEKMDRFFDRLSAKANQLSFTLAEDKVCNVEDITSAISGAFSGESLNIELRRTFRHAEEYFTLRGALVQLKTKLGDNGAAAAEATLRPYLHRKIELAFDKK
ncbi:MAG: hypothetical protein ABIH70_00775 [Chloroflexota bacterium]